VSCLPKCVHSYLRSSLGSRGQGGEGPNTEERDKTRTESRDDHFTSNTISHTGSEHLRHLYNITVTRLWCSFYNTVRPARTMSLKRIFKRKCQHPSRLPFEDLQVAVPVFLPFIHVHNATCSATVRLLALIRTLLQPSLVRTYFVLKYAVCEANTLTKNINDELVL
jgi:hypothetical protein